MDSIGMIETYGLITAIEAADASLKAAEVKLMDIQFVKGGLVAIILKGDVAAVKSAVDAGSAAGNKVGRIVSTHVIARPDTEIKLMYHQAVKQCRKEVASTETPVASSIEKKPRAVKKTVATSRKTKKTK